MFIDRQRNPDKGGTHNCDECGKPSSVIYFLQGDHTKEVKDDYEIGICPKCFNRLEKIVVSAKNNLRRRLDEESKAKELDGQEQKVVL